MNLEQANIGQLVSGNYRTAAVFSKYRIDFCCNGNRSVEEACNQKKIDIQAVTADLAAVLDVLPENGTDYNTWQPDVLAIHIVDRHHGYVANQIPVLQAYLHKLSNVHGNAHPELVKIAQLFNESAAELTMHMKKEELVLFPYIRQMVIAQQNGTKAAAPHFGAVEGPIAMMMHEHDQEGERFRQIQALSNDYTVPPDGCNTYRVTYSLLKEFQEDLHLHIHRKTISFSRRRPTSSAVLVNLPDSFPPIHSFIRQLPADHAADRHSHALATDQLTYNINAYQTDDTYDPYHAKWPFPLPDVIEIVDGRHEGCISQLRTLTKQTKL